MSSIQRDIEHILRDALRCAHLAINNESAQHAANMGGESHFHVTIVSDDFVGTSLIARHRRVMTLLKDVLAGPVHALSLHTYTPDEWAGVAPPSPPCRHRAKT